MEKLNIYTDCSFKSSKQPSGLGIIAYIENRIIFQIIIPRLGVLSSTNGEVLAAYEALKIALMYDENYKVVLNTDCEHVYFIFNEIKFVREDKKLLQDVSILINKFNNLEVKLIKRNKNKEADKLAFQARKLLNSNDNIDVWEFNHVIISKNYVDEDIRRRHRHFIKNYWRLQNI